MAKNTMVLVIVAFMLGCCLKQMMNPVCDRMKYERFSLSERPNMFDDFPSGGITTLQKWCPNWPWVPMKDNNDPNKGIFVNADAFPEIVSRDTTPDGWNWKPFRNNNV